MKNTLLIVIGALMLIAIALPAMAGIAESIGFESSTYALGNVNGQDGWVTHWGGYAGMNVTNTGSLSGAQSLAGGPGSNVFRSISTFDKTTITMLIKLDANSDGFVYLTDPYVDTLNWTRIAAWGWGVYTPVDGTRYISSVPLTAGDIYKVQWDYNFTNLTGVVSVVDTTTSANMGSLNFTLSALSPNNIPTTGSSGKMISMYEITGNTMYDNINISETVVPEPSSILVMLGGGLGILTSVIRRKR